MSTPTITLPHVHADVQIAGTCAHLQVSRTSGGSVGSLAAHDPQQDVPFDDVRLGGLLGKGSFGSVFIGVAGGTPCAVKVGSSARFRVQSQGLGLV